MPIIDPNSSPHFSGPTPIADPGSARALAETSEVADTIATAGNDQTTRLGGGISMIAFFDAVNEMLSLAETNQRDWEFFQNTLNTNLFRAASGAALTARLLIRQTYDEAEAANEELAGMNAHIAAYNNAVNAFNAGFANEQAQTDAFNSALSDYQGAVEAYNDPGSIHYQDDAYLAGATSEWEAAVNTYNAFVDARNADIDAYEAARATYNQYIASENAGLPPDTTPFLTVDAAYSHKARVSSSTTTAQTAGASIVELSGVSAVVDTTQLDILAASLGFMSHLVREVDAKEVAEEFGDYLLKLLLSMLPSMFVYQLATAVFSDQSSHTTGFGMGIGLQGSTLGRLFGRPLTQALTIDAATAVSPRTFEQLQLAAFSLLSNSSTESAMGAAFRLLGSGLARTSSGAPSVALAHAMATTARILESAATGPMEELVTTLIADNPQLAHLPAAAEQGLTEQLVATMRLMLMLKVLLNDAVALNRPAVVTQLLLLAADRAGVELNPTSTSLTALIGDRSLVAAASLPAIELLLNRGVDVEEARSMVLGSYNRAVEAVPYNSIGEFAQALNGELQLAGIGDPQEAQLVALLLTTQLANLGAAYPLESEGAIFVLTNTLFEGITSDEALEQLVGDRQELRERVLNALEQLFELGAPAALLTHSPVAFDGDLAPPFTAEEIEIALGIFLKAEGVDAEAATGITERAMALLQVAPEALPPAALLLGERFLERALREVGVTPALAVDISTQVTAAIADADGDLLTNFTAVSELVNPVVAYRAEQLGTLTAFLLEQRPTLPPFIAVAAAQSVLQQLAPPETRDAWLSLLRATPQLQGPEQLADVLLSDPRVSSALAGDALAARLESLPAAEILAPLLKVIPLNPQIVPPHLIDPDRSLVAALVAHGVASDAAPALAVGIAIQAVHTPGALDSNTAFQIALTDAWAAQTGGEGVVAPRIEVVPELSANATFQALLSERLHAVGVSRQDGDGIVMGMTYSDYIDTQSLVVSLESELLVEGKISPERATEMANEALLLAFAQPTAYVSMVDFRSALKDALYILGVSPTAARALSETLGLDGVFNKEQLKADLLAQVQAVSPNVSEGYVSLSLLNIFDIGPNDFSNTDDLTRMVQGGAEPSQSLLDALAATPTVQSLGGTV